MILSLSNVVRWTSQAAEFGNYYVLNIIRDPTRSELKPTTIVSYYCRRFIRVDRGSNTEIMIEMPSALFARDFISWSIHCNDGIEAITVAHTTLQGVAMPYEHEDMLNDDCDCDRCFNTMGNRICIPDSIRYE